MITLYHFPTSPCAAKVRAVLTEKQLPWDGKIIDIIEKENLRPDYLKLHPKGVVPALVDDGHTIIESTIIMEYLDTKYAPHSLKPVGAYGQACMRKWMKWVDETLHPSWAGLGWTILVRPSWLEKSRQETDALLAKLIDPTRRARQVRLLSQGFGSSEFAVSMRVLDTTLAEMEKTLAGQPWLVGDAPTLADLALLPYVISTEKFGLEMMYEDGRPGVAEWLARWRRRPTYS
ncbi:MAG: glutathione S-transferase family protein, partial [Proteobacteria bacterium]|nr:glutathione S-transferase family protein [Pseudomonadota bacterium]